MKFDQNKIDTICKKWKISELALFGSVLRDDFDPKRSDVDILISFLPEAEIGWDIVILKEDLERVFGRPVDIVFKNSIERSFNPYRKAEILENYEVIFDQAA